MVRLSTVAHMAGLLSGILVLAGCEGRVLRLGNGWNAEDGGRTPDGGNTPSDAPNPQEQDSAGVSIDAGCPHSQIAADEVAWIGETWVTIPGTQHTRVRDYARQTGAIGPSDDYTIAAAPYASMAAIFTQYGTQEASQTKVKVLIMDGGTYDTIISNGSDSSVTSVVATFRQLLAQVAADGTVGHVIYYLCPELPGIPGVAALRPQLEQACTESSVPCHFLDLQPLWAGHPEYSNGIQASEAGARVIADAIWSIMQQSCIAQ